ncbi:GNAT family acetyltransferase [Sphingomonas quercus]|uniref:GNAT family acetyltransferase n=1 Tax=Sphingomonas quercus TaxID=2842451 RepID=A0ABS6BFI9_9SPHN|nr:GNAT family acetyltransferase [Sphingomonas quercus]MBU3076342.1 GNAT family acetyltransferase [Sphingomonas quercus]
MSLSIADLTPEAPAAVALWQAAGLTRPWNDPAADINAALACASSTVLAGHDEGGRLIATVMAGYDGHRGWLYYLAVAGDRQGEGLGRQMVAAAEGWLAGQGAPVVRLMVRTDNAPVAAFYERLGYEPSEVRVLGRRLS